MKQNILSIFSNGSLGVVSFENDSSNTSVISPQIAKAFISSQSAGLLALAAAHTVDNWAPSLLYWRDFTVRYLHELSKYAHSGLEIEPISAPTKSELDKMLLDLPPVQGAEYCTANVLENIWTDFDHWIRNEITKLEGGINEFLQKHLPAWHQIGRVCFHLAENKNDQDFPFAFLATYAPRLGKNARVQYQPLREALQEYAGERNKKILYQLLKPVHEASERCTWVKELLDSGDIYHPLAWTPQEAYELLKNVPQLEESGVLVRLPDWWKKRPRPRVQVSIGNKKQKSFGVDTLLDFKIDVALSDEKLTKEELNSILSAKNGLVALRGQWVEVDREKLEEALKHWKSVQDEAEEGGLSFIEGMRLLSGADRELSGKDKFNESEKDWAYVNAGNWLKDILKNLRQPESLQTKTVKLSNALLRPYQTIGVNWLHFLTQLGLGACLADDMGLGKTIQIIALLLIKNKQKTQPSLLILPASLLSNWKSELERFAPSLKPLYLHTAETSRNDIDKIAANPEKLREFDLVLTTYSTLVRQPWLQKQSWDLVILDEAQAIKTPTAGQTKAVKALKGKARIALTGTPVENRLGDLWSLFDFLCPGLLGSTSRFKNFIKSLEKNEHTQFSPLRKLVQPYILRRLKTDKTIISDLPEKTEVVRWCGLTKEQAGIYAQSVKQLKTAIKNEEGIKRRGLVLSYLMRFKQICNHPSQMLGDGQYDPSKSGKFERLREICEEIASRQEKVLIFTQFREMTKPLSDFLSGVFGQSGLILHGSTPVKQRKKLIEQFQNEINYPFFVLSLKAAGTGLNLTAASHVIHFDRWWNPAVENQATDRAFRIGQKRNVLVHKFVCRGTVEEKIDGMIAEKIQLADNVLKSGGETLLTELDDNALIDLVSLDLDKANF